MKIKAKDLHCVVILANYWLLDKSKKTFKDEIRAAEKIRSFCRKLKDEDKILIEKIGESK